MTFPTCHCGETTRLSTLEQSEEQLYRGVDNYVCRNGHEIEAAVPFEVERSVAVRADL